MTQSAAPLTTTLYVHDINDHIIAETDASGATLREYIWLNDLPIAVVDQVNTASPVIYYVHTDHLGRPARLIAQDGTAVWDVIYAPFGGVSYIWSANGFSGQDMRFPGQWFQLETGLAYNWHRHYDATLGRYVQPDPLRVDEKEGEMVGGVTPSVLRPQSSLIDQIYLRSGALRFGAAEGVASASSAKRANYSDGPSVYGYSTQNPLVVVDSAGLTGTVSGGSFSHRKLQPGVCLRAESCTDHYVKCTESTLPPGSWSCGQCHFFCTGINGYWPFEHCPY